MFNKVAVDLWAGCGLQTSAQARVTHYMLPGTLDTLTANYTQKRGQGSDKMKRRG